RQRQRRIRELSARKRVSFRRTPVIQGDADGGQAGAAVRPLRYSPVGVFMNASPLAGRTPARHRKPLPSRLGSALLAVLGLLSGLVVLTATAPPAGAVPGP